MTRGVRHTGVVGLAEVAKQTSGGRSVNDTSILLLLEVWPCGTSALLLLAVLLSILTKVSYLECASHVYGVDEIPILVRHVLEANIAEDAGIVYEDVDTAEIVNGGLDDRLAILYAVVVRSGLPASLLDLVDDDISGL